MKHCGRCWGPNHLSTCPCQCHTDAIEDRLSGLSGEDR